MSEIQTILAQPNVTPDALLYNVYKERGLLWEDIARFHNELKQVAGVVLHNTEEMQTEFPTKHHIDNGLYTREVFMPQGSLVVSFIHKQNHPSFFLQGSMSLLMDDGQVKHIKAPQTVFTEIGTQRVAYMHEDCVWACVYRTDAETVEEAEKEVYTLDYRELPEHIIFKQQVLCQE